MILGPRAGAAAPPVAASLALGGNQQPLDVISSAGVWPSDLGDAGNTSGQQRRLFSEPLFARVGQLGESGNSVPPRRLATSAISALNHLSLLLLRVVIAIIQEIPSGFLECLLLRFF